jgi:uroporphyrinogen decarboxylase
MQTSREVIDALIRNNKKAERMGFFDSPWGQTVDKWVKNEGYPVHENHPKKKPHGDVEHFNMDMVSVGGWFDLMPLRGHNEVIEETADWKITRNGAGAAFKRWKTQAGTPEHIDFRMTSRAVWDRDYRPHVLKAERERINFEDLKRNYNYFKEQKRWIFVGHLFIWEHMRQTMGDVCMFESLVLDPDWVHDFCRVYTDFFKAHFKMMFDEVGLPDGAWLYEDLGYNKGLFCSPAILEELIMPYHKEMVDFFHSYNLPVVLHSCGNVTEAMPLIVQAGYDALNPMEVKAGCDIFTFAGKYGDKLAFVGGFDARILESGDKAKIRKSVIEYIGRLKDVGARWVFGSDHSLSTNVTLASFNCAVETYREHMMY